MSEVQESVSYKNESHPASISWTSWSRPSFSSIFSGYLETLKWNLYFTQSYIALLFISLFYSEDRVIEHYLKIKGLTRGQAVVQ